MPDTPGAIRQRIRHTAQRIKHLKKVLPALQQLQRKRRQQLTDLIEKPGKPASNRLDVFGIDYAWGNPHPATLKQAHVRFCMRYLSHDASKNLKLPELKSLHAVGIKAGVVWESTASRALGGYQAGRADAYTAKAQVNALGLRDIPVYFACDWDVNDAQKPIVAKYLNGAASVLGKQRVGVYGSYYVVRYCVEHDACDWFWQTYAWSGGLVHPATHVYQYRNAQRLDGVSVDYNKASAAGLESMR
jgi:hypothetical protein